MTTSPLQPAALTVRAFDEASQLLIEGSSLGLQSFNLANAESKLEIQAVIDSGISCLKLIQTLDLTDTDILQSGHAEVGGLLTADDQFFEGEKLDELVENAIADLNRGETVEMREMGD